VLFPWVFAVRAQRLSKPPPHGTAGIACGIAHGASMQVSRSALKPIVYCDTPKPPFPPLRVQGLLALPTQGPGRGK